MTRQLLVLMAALVGVGLLPLPAKAAPCGGAQVPKGLSPELAIPLPKSGSPVIIDPSPQPPAVSIQKALAPRIEGTDPPPYNTWTTGIVTLGATGFKWGMRVTVCGANFGTTPGQILFKYDPKDAGWPFVNPQFSDSAVVGNIPNPGGGQYDRTAYVQVVTAQGKSNVMAIPFVGPRVPDWFKGKATSSKCYYLGWDDGCDTLNAYHSNLYHKNTANGIDIYQLPQLKNGWVYVDAWFVSVSTNSMVASVTNFSGQGMSTASVDISWSLPPNIDGAYKFNAVIFGPYLMSPY